MDTGQYNLCFLLCVFFNEQLLVVTSVSWKTKTLSQRNSMLQILRILGYCFRYSGASYLAGGLWGAPMFIARPFSSCSTVWALLGIPEQSRREWALQVQPGLTAQDSRRKCGARRKSQSIKYNQLANHTQGYKQEHDTTFLSYNYLVKGMK